MAPPDQYIHGNDSQPQRRDPLVLDHRRARMMDIASAPQQLTLLLAGRQMLGGEASAQRLFLLVEEQIALVIESLDVLRDVLATADVNRAWCAPRSNRGFATSSDLADLLAIDLEIPRDEAVRLAARVVVEATEAGG